MSLLVRIYVAVVAKSQEEAEQLVTKLEAKEMLVLRTCYIGSTFLNGLKVSQNYFAMTSTESGAGLFRT